VTPHSPSHAPLVFWTWGDDAIENPRQIKVALEAMHEAGVRGFLVMLKETRYTLLDARVIRTISQVSQWSKKRGMAFWLHMDPRQASRQLIRETGERLQFLLTETVGGGRPVTPLNDPHFEIEFDWSGLKATPWLQEGAIMVEPVRLERAYLFQAIDGRIHPKSIHDITAYTQISNNIALQKTSVFGEIHLPDDEAWYVCAFPKFNTNLYDYAGRESNDALSIFVENLFDGLTHLDGVAWAEGGPPAMVPPAFLPVSLSIFNAFHSEKGYDLRDKLYTLAFETADRAHLQVRYDYYDFLNRTLLIARRDFHRNMHSFFPGVAVGAHHQRLPAVSDAQRNAGASDPWRNMSTTAAGFNLIEHVNGNWPSALLARLIGLKSITARGTRPVYSSLPWRHLSAEQYRMTLNWTTVLGLEASPLLHHSGQLTDDEAQSVAALVSHHRSLKENRPPSRPLADTAVVFPFETLITSDLSTANDRVGRFAHWITALLTAGHQIDVISSVQFKQARLEKKGLAINRSHYKSLILPFPNVLSESLIAMLSGLHQAQFPVYYLGNAPQWRLSGQPIDLPEFPLAKTPEALQSLGLIPALTTPKHVIATLFQTADGLEVRAATLCTGIKVKDEMKILGQTVDVEIGDEVLFIDIADKMGQSEAEERC